MRNCLKRSLCGLVAGFLSLPIVMAQDATGTWTWSFAPQGGDAITITLKLKQDGAKLNGTITRRDGSETPIENGAVNGKDLTFRVVREFNGQTVTMKYQGALADDTIKGKIESERDGQTRTRDWEAKREKSVGDPTGTWKWTTTSQSGQTRENTLKLKREGDKLAGTLVGRNGNEIALEQGSLKGDQITFNVTRERNGEKFTTKYQGTLAGNTIKGKIESEAGGQTRTRDWEAKREGIDPTGTWTWSITLDNGQSIESKLKLKMAEGKLSGVQIRNENETPIQDAKLTGDEISYKVVRERDGNSFTINYKGKISGDAIKGKISANFNGEDRTFDWDAKRTKE